MIWDTFSQQPHTNLSNVITTFAYEPRLLITMVPTLFLRSVVLSKSLLHFMSFPRDWTTNRTNVNTIFTDQVRILNRLQLTSVFVILTSIDSCVIHGIFEITTYKTILCQ